MNKLVLDNDITREELDSITIKDNIYYFTSDSFLNLETTNRAESLSFHINDNVTAMITIVEDNSNLNLSYYLGTNSRLTVNHFVTSSSDTITVLLEKKDSTVEYNYSGLFQDKSYETTVDIKHLASNTISNIYNHAVSFTSPFVFNITGEVLKTSAGCICNQDNKIINLGNSLCLIKPNLLISNDDIEASHSAYIGKFNKEEVFYLESRGLSLVKSYNLLMKGFVLGNMKLKDEDYEKLNQIIENYGGDYNES